MSAVDLDRLFNLFYTMEADQLYCLDRVDFPGIPKITGFSVPAVIANIRLSISAIPDVKKRLQCIRGIYACFVANRVMGPWVLYHVPDAQYAGEDSLVNRFVRQMNSKRVLAESMSVSAELVHTCALVAETNRPTTGHDVYCLTFYTSSPCVAVYRPPEGHSDGVRQVLGSIFGGDPTEFEEDEYFYQDAVDRTAMSLAPPTHSSQGVGER
ncbi:hypothetical protein MTO96_034217 [Rhipicephalus appendiculatus]